MEWWSSDELIGINALQYVKKPNHRPLYMFKFDINRQLLPSDVDMAGSTELSVLP